MIKMKNSITCLVVILFLNIPFMRFETSNETVSKHESEIEEELSQKTLMFKNLDLKLKTFLKFFAKASISYMMEIVEEVNITSSCKRTAMTFLRDLTQLKIWALKLIDSFGKPSAGILRFSPWIQGDYDQCLNIRIEENQETYFIKKEQAVRGKYCVVILEYPEINPEIFEKIIGFKNNSLIDLFTYISKPLKLPKIYNRVNAVTVNLRFDACIPSTCSKNDLMNTIKWAFGDSVTFRIDYCKTIDEKFNISTAEIGCILILCLFLVWVAIGTIMDALIRRKLFPANDITRMISEYMLLASLYRSISALFTINIKENTRWMCGIKFLQINVIIFCHQIAMLFYLFLTGDQLRNLLDVANNTFYGIFFQGPITIETFFFISGFLTLYVRRKSKTNPEMDCFLFILKKYIRLTAAIFFILLITVVFPLLGDGPQWYYIIRKTEYLKAFWWQYLLHIRNFFEDRFSHLMFLWYIQVEVQLLIITFPLLIIQERWPRTATIIVFILSIGGTVTHISNIYKERYYGLYGISANFGNVSDYVINHYLKPYYSHLTSYLIGWLIGNALRNRSLPLGKVTVIFAWIGFFSMTSLSTFGIHYYLHRISANENITLLFQSFAPLLWTLGIACICIICTTGNGGIINKFLSLKIFVILNDLIAWIYLLHVFIFLYINGETRKAVLTNELNLWMKFAFVMFLTLIMSFIAFILLHSPIHNLISKLFNKSFQKKKEFKLEMNTLPNGNELQTPNV